MQVLKYGGFVVLAGLFLSGCNLVPGVTEKPVEDNRPVQERVEDFESYKKAKDVNLANGNASGLENCSKYSDLEEQVQDGEVTMLTLFSGDNYSLKVYQTANYTNLTTPVLSDYNTKCLEGAGSNSILKAFPNALVWGFPSCTAGAAPDVEDASYQEFIDCQEMAEDLQEYLAS